MIEKFLNWWLSVMPAIGLAPITDDEKDNNDN
jgi:hypothetical protein